MPEVLLSFRGRVACTRGAAPLGLTLCGLTGTSPGETTVLAFSAAAPEDLPATLEDPVIEQLAPQRYRIASAAGSWLLGATAVHVHRDVGTAFYRELPPRPVPLGRRVLWSLALTLAASRAGLALLKALRR